MRKIIYAMNVSLDGFIESTNGDIGWSTPDEELHKHFNHLESTIDTHLYGRRMYEIMAGYWPTADENPSAPEYEIEYARLWKNKPNIVFSKTLDNVGPDDRLVRGDIVEEVMKLKEQPGRDMDVGGAAIASAFMQFGLIDEYQLYIHPIILGGGKPMFPKLPHRIALRLVETRTFGSGVVLLRYLRASGGDNNRGELT